MKLKASVSRSIVTVVGCLVFAGQASALGVITGLTVDPSPACLNQPVKVTILGSGSCDQGIYLDFIKDVDTVQLTSPGPFPVEVQHTYTQTGTVTLRARGVNPFECSTTKETTLTIQDCGRGGNGRGSRGGVTIVVDGKVAELCKVVDCGGSPQVTLGPTVPIPYIAPRIEAALGAVGNPGRVVLLMGKSFGTSLGQVILHAGNGQSRVLPVDAWGPQSISARMPHDIGGACVEPFEIEVVTQAGLKSNRWKLAALRDYRILEQKDVKVVKCDNDGNWNYCNGVNPGGDWCSSSQPFTASPGASASVLASHSNCWGAIGDDKGTDTYQVGPLKNGWGVSGAVFKSWTDGGYTIPSSNSLPGGFQSGASTWKFNVSWNAKSGSTVVYGMDIQVGGPECGSHK